MAQTSASPDFAVQTSRDPSFGDDQLQSPQSDEKHSFMGRVKAKTKEGTHKLRTKLKRGSKNGESGAQEDSSSSGSSSEDEAETPTNNAMQGRTQAEYQKELDEGQAPRSTDQSAESTQIPATHFPGSFTGIVGAESQHKEEDSGLSREFESLSTKDASESQAMDADKPLTEKASEGVTSMKDTVLEKVDSQKQSVASPEEAGAAPVTEKAEESSAKTAEVGKSWGQWAAEKVGYVKDSAVSKLPSSEDSSLPADEKPATTRAFDAAEGAKETLNKQVVQPAYEASVGASDALAEKTATDENAAPAAGQTYVQKATSGLYAAKDSLLSSTKPGEEHKALSQAVTETVGNLPNTIKSSLGFGAKSTAASSPTTTPVSTETPIEESSANESHSPGIVSRISSYFGTKKPTPAEEAQISESGTETPVSETKTD